MSPAEEEARVRTRRRWFWGWRRIHKWVAIVAGAMLTVWIVTGMYISIPGAGGAALTVSPPRIDLREVSLSPADAIAAVEARRGAAVEVRDLRLEALGSRPAYFLRLGGGEVVLLDARTGDHVEIDRAEAIRMVEEHLGPESRVAGVDVVERRSLGYLRGELPAYRVRVEGPSDAEAYIGRRTGSLSFRDGRVRVRELMYAAHDLWPIGVRFGRDLRLWILMGTGALALVATLTGYWLAVRKWRPFR